MGSATQVRIFFSSPGDVKMERETARRIVDRLQGEVGERMIIEPYFWEHEVMVATKDYQENIPEMDGFDIVVCVLWSRLGTPLHPNRHPRPDGGFFESGTEYEFFTAMQAHKLRGTPDIFVFRNSTEPRRPSRPKEAREAVDREVDRLDHFFERYFQEEQYFTGAVNVYSTLGEFEDKLTLALRSFIEGRHPLSNAGKSPRKSQYAGLPYLGLAAFDFKDAPVFFGRTAQIGEVVEAFQSQELDAQANDGGHGKRFVLILGSSGSGKSSLARAGVLPMLVQPGVIEGTQAWRRVIFKPGDAGGDPFAAFAAALMAPEALPELGSAGTTPAEIAALIRTEGGGGEILLRQALAQAGAAAHAEEETRLLDSVRKFEAENRETDAFLLREKISTLTAPIVRLAVLADQLEELFTTGISDEIIAAFIDRLTALATSGRVFVLGTLRSDFYPRCLEHPKLVELMRASGSYALPAPGPGDLGQMIRQPAAAAGLTFEENRATGEKLDELLRDAAIKDPGALPLLSYTLEQLYERRTHDGLLTLAAYHDLGGLEGAIGRRAEAIFSALPAEAQAAFDPVWRQLVTLSEGSEPVRRRASFTALTPSAGATHLVETLTAARLLTIDQVPAGERSVSVAHEALLRHWPRVVDWVRENLDFLRARSRMAARLSEWLEHESSDDYLIPAGPPLAEAEGILAKHERSLDAREIDFIQKSAARARRHDQARLRRARLIATGAVALSILAITGGVFALLQSKAADRERVAAVQQKVIAENAAKAALASQTRAAYLLGIEMLEAGKSREGLTSLAQALTLAPDHQGARDRLYSYHLYGLPKAIPIRSVTGPEGKRQRISGAEIGPTEICAYLTKTKAVEAYDLVAKKVVPGPWEQEPDSLAAIVFQSNQFIFNLRNDLTGRRWNIATGEPGAVISVDPNFSQLGFTDDGRWLLEGTPEGRVRLWSFESGKVVHEWNQKGPITNLLADTYCRRLVVSSEELVFFDLEKGKEITRVPAVPNTNIAKLKFSADGTVLVAQDAPQLGMTGDSHFKFYRADDGERLKSRELASEGEIFDFTVNRDGTAIAIANFSSSAKIWHRDDEKLDRAFLFDTYPVNVLFSPDEHLLIAASTDGTVRIFDAEKETLAFEPISHDGRLEDLHISWDGRYLLTGTSRQARVWDLSVGRALTLPLEQTGRVEGASFSPDGGKLWIASSTGIQPWDAGKLEKTGPALLADKTPWDVIFDRTAHRLSARLENDRLLWLDFTAENPTPMEWKASGEINFHALTLDGKLAAAAVGDAVFLIDPATGKPTGQPWKIAEPINGLQFSGDGKFLIILTLQRLHLIDLASRSEREIADGKATLGITAASPDGRWLAVVAYGSGMAVTHEVLVWDFHSPLAAPRRLPHGDRPLALTFSDDGRLLATGSRDQYAQVWSPETGEPLSDPIFHQNNVVQQLAFSPDGRLLATGCGDHSVRVWDWSAAKPASGKFQITRDVSRLIFSPDGRKLMGVTPSTKTDVHATLTYVWEVSPSPEAPIDLIALTEAATAQKVSTNHLPTACDPFESWQRIRQKSPGSWFLQPPGSRSISPNLTASSLCWITDPATGIDPLLLSLPSVGIVNAAMGNWKQVDLSKAMKELEKLDEKSEEYKTEYARLSVNYLEVDRLVEMANRNTGEDAWTSYYLSLQAENAARKKVALAHIEKALSLDPENPAFISQAADLYFVLGKNAEAIPVLKKLRTLEPGNDRHLVRLSNSLWKTGAKQEAAELFAIALQRPDIAAVDRACMLVMLGRSKEALPIFLAEADRQKTASADGKYDAQNLLYLIVSRHLTGDTVAAIEFYREIIAAIPGTADSTLVAGLDLSPEFKDPLQEVLKLTLAKYPELAPLPAKE